MGTAIVIGALALAVAAVAQAVRIGMRRGDWSGLIPVVMIVLLMVVILVTMRVPVGD